MSIPELLAAGPSAPMVCIVDDDDDVRDSLKALLEAHGLRVRDFASALAFLEGEGARDCGCLLLDLHMPAMSGLELLECLRAEDVDIPALMITGQSDPALSPRLQRAGLLGILPKPVSEGELLTSIAGAMAFGVPDAG